MFSGSFFFRSLTQALFKQALLDAQQFQPLQHLSTIMFVQRLQVQENYQSYPPPNPPTEHFRSCAVHFWKQLLDEQLLQELLTALIVYLFMYGSSYNKCDILFPNSCLPIGEISETQSLQCRVHLMLGWIHQIILRINSHLWHVNGTAAHVYLLVHKCLVLCPI